MAEFILVVDDEATVRELVVSQLDFLGFPARHTEDAEEALGIAAGTDGVDPPALVLLDIEMPGLTGLQVASALAPPRPRIVFCTAYDRYALEAFDQHATDYLLKPVERGRLARAVQRLLEQTGVIALGAGERTTYVPEQLGFQ